MFNKVLLGKWSSKFTIERAALWKRVIVKKFRVEEQGRL